MQITLTIPVPDEIIEYCKKYNMSEDKIDEIMISIIDDLFHTKSYTKHLYDKWKNDNKELFNK